MAEKKRTVGKVTGASTAGGGLGAALAQIVVHIWPYLAEVEAAVTVVLTVALALVGGYLVPPDDDAEAVEPVRDMGPEDFESEDLPGYLPGGTTDFARHDENS